jgi:predicted permease
MQRAIDMLRHRFRSLLGKSWVERELSEELRFHLERTIEQNITRGMTPEEARRRALVDIGGVEQIKEECREAYGWSFFEDIWRDFRYSLRMLGKSPGFVAVSVLTLALGTGANVALFGLLDALVLRPLPVPHPEQLVRFGVRYPGNTDKFFTSLSVPMFLEFSRDAKTFSSTFAWSGNDVDVEANAEFSTAATLAVTGNYFSEIGATPRLGRLIEPNDVDLKTGLPMHVAVLSYRFWKTRFGSSQDAVGKAMRIEGVPFVVIGVTQRGLRGVSAEFEPDVTIPLTAEPLIETAGGARVKWDELWVSAEGRLKPGTTVAQACAQLEVLWPGIRHASILAKETSAQRAQFEAMQLWVGSGAHGGGLLESKYARPASVLLTISGLVLLVACVNLACLMLVRSASRSHEIGVRVALGAGAWRLARQMLIESLTLSVVGTAVGVALAYWASHALVWLILTPFYGTGLGVDLEPNLRLLAFASVVSILTGVLSGLAPGWQAVRVDPRSALAGGGRTLGFGAGRLARRLVVIEVGLSLVLVTCAGLFLRSLEKLHGVQPGFRTHDLLGATLAPLPGGYRNLDWVSYYRELVENVSGLPGVTSAGIGALGMGATAVWQQRVEPLGARERSLSVDCDVVTPGFFRTVAIRLVRGRTFTWEDNGHPPFAVVVSASLARALFPHGNALGQRLVLPDLPRNWSPVEIVGIVSDARLYDIRERDLRVLYFSKLQHPDLGGGGTLWLQARKKPEMLAGTIKSTVTSLGHEYVASLNTIGDDINQSFLQERLTAMLGGFFGALALLLASIGLYGLMAYSVSGRTREFGLRMALGARRGAIAKMVIMEAGKLALTGLVFGIMCGLGATRFLAHMLYGISASDPLTMTAAASALTFVAALAAYLPARRAMRVDPVVALRHE